jgi:hypothetical protein
MESFPGWNAPVPADFGGGEGGGGEGGSGEGGALPGIMHHARALPPRDARRWPP